MPLQRRFQAEAHRDDSMAAGPMRLLSLVGGNPNAKPSAPGTAGSALSLVRKAPTQSEAGVPDVVTLEAPDGTRRQFPRATADAIRARDPEVKLVV